MTETKVIAGAKVNLRPWYTHKETGDDYYMTITDQAKIVRKLLKKNFPGVKFSVRSKKYSGGCSMDIDWVDGPTEEEVKRITRPMEGSGFDGMIDMAYYKTPWMLPDGSFTWGASPGSIGSGGLDLDYKYPKPHPEALRIHGGADYIFANRRKSLEFLTEIYEYLKPLLPEDANLVLNVTDYGYPWIDCEWNLRPHVNRVIDNSKPGNIAPIGY